MKWNFWKKNKKANLGFWEQLPRPIVVLAPMADVTDVAFRQMFAKYGKPDVTWTEFVSADGLCLAPKEVKDGDRLSGHDTLWKDLLYFENERPIVAQLFSGNPKYMKQSAYEVTLAGFDGIDINMGCPDKSVQRQGAGAYLINDFKKARKVISAVQAGVLQACKEIGKEPIPVSVKTRLGFNTDIMEEWLKVLLGEGLAVVTLHARTRKEMSKVPARWGRIADAVKVRDALGSPTLIFGNGDVTDMDDARAKARATGCDGVMVGRGIFGRPDFFADTNLTLPERLEALIEHTHLFEKHLSHKSFNIMKKHYKAYVNGFDGAKELRIDLMECANAHEVEKRVREFLNTI